MRGVLFDLLMAVMDSLTVWTDAAGGRRRGLEWRDAVTARMMASGSYAPYESLVAGAAAAMPRDARGSNHGSCYRLRKPVATSPIRPSIGRPAAAWGRTLLRRCSSLGRPTTRRGARAAGLRSTLVVRRPDITPTTPPSSSWLPSIRRKREVVFQEEE
ncbi:MAG: hypothetical protein H0U11_01850 [Chloroflexi bacterium]|nr:hypothetical protein [Chloroflexota bacterium]